MRKLWVFLKDYKKESIIAPLFKMLEALFDLMVPLVVASIINKGIKYGDKHYIYQMCGVLILLAVVGLTCALCAQYFAAKAAVGFAAKLRHALFTHIQSFSFTELDTQGTSALMNRMTSDVNQLQNGVNMALRLLLRSPFIVFGAMIMAFTVNVQAAFTFVVVIPVLFVIVFGIIFLTLPLYRKVQERLDQVLRRTRENLSGVRVIRAFHRENEEIKSFRADNEELKKKQLFVGKISALMNPLTYVVINLGVIALLANGGVKVSAGVMEQGDVVALLDYMSQILVELVKLANTIVLLTRALASGKRVAGVLEVESSMEFTDAPRSLPSVGEGEEIIGFSHVDLTYAGAGDKSLEDVTFSIKKGQTVGIIGGTGSGKTSLVHLIPRFYDATGGEVRIAGRDIKTYSRQQLRDMVGIVMQKAVLFRGTIRANLLWGKKDATEEELWKALAIAQAKEIVEGKEDGLEEEIEQGGRNLSGGQRQRLAIARTLVGQHPILILDDSSSALDYATDARLRMAIAALDPKPTVLIVSQRAASILYADLIIVMDDGKVVGQGTHEQLLETCAVYREIYDSQFDSSRTAKGGV
ncbi:MAG: ABC transporter ATP-binding protein [Lachnospiraceae bacterium]|nr:ABC transporter ATP-binding protein [bacterium]MDY5516284.1 ABC transporter ATP-binding protein [Lachnospiraceae bacterium]